MTVRKVRIWTALELVPATCALLAPLWMPKALRIPVAIFVLLVITTRIMEPSLAMNAQWAITLVVLVLRIVMNVHQERTST